MRGLALLILLILTIASSALADVTLEAELGWGRQIRPGRWNLATATLRADAVTPATLEWYVPRPGRQAMVMRLPIMINPRPATFSTFLPLESDIPVVHARVVDDATGRTLATWRDDRQMDASLSRRIVSGEGFTGRPFVGVTGPEPAMQILEPAAVAAYLPTESLPSTAVGFDALDVLALHRADLSTLSLDQQTAIVQWTHAGGVLWVTLGIEPLPDADASPIVQLLEETLPGLPTTRNAIELENGSATYVSLAGVEGQPFITRGAAGAGAVLFLHVDPALLSVEQRAELNPSIRDVKPTRDVVAAGVDEDRFAPPLSWIALLAVLGPLEWLILRLAGRAAGRVRRRPLWLSMIAFTAFVAVIGWRAATSEPPQSQSFDPQAQWWSTLGDGRTQGAIREFEVAVTPREITPIDTPIGNVERYAP